MRLSAYIVFDCMIVVAPDLFRCKKKIDLLSWPS
jgi:hypothetical protein